VHGFRSCLRDWCAEATAHPREAAEQALAHALADRVEAAYRGGDMLGKRAGSWRSGRLFAGHRLPGKSDGAPSW
jgi:hypothetical protein